MLAVLKIRLVENVLLERRRSATQYEDNKWLARHNYLTLVLADCGAKCESLWLEVLRLCTGSVYVSVCGGAPTLG